jgi:hypothetical protein
LEVGELIFSERCGLPGRRRLAEQWMLTLRMVSTVPDSEGLSVSSRRGDALIGSELVSIVTDESELVSIVTDESAPC